MKTIRSRAIATAACLLFATAVHTYAIEGLKLSLQCSNVVLTWPSLDGETYIVQYCPTLDTNSSWKTLTNFMPAEVGMTNTTFVHSNAVIMAVHDGGGSFAAMSSGQSSSMALAVESDTPSEPMAFPTNGIGSGVPLQLFPPGFDMTPYYIYDPSSDEFVSGSLLSSSTDGEMQANDIEFPPAEEGGGITNSSGDFIAETAFYRVVRNGVHLVGITDGINLSGVVTIPVEVGTDAGILAALSVREDGSPVGNSQAIAPFQGPLQIVLDTTAMSNGVHQITGYASWISGGDEDGTTGVDAESPPITVNVYNEITFPTWIEHFGELYDSVLITAQLGHADADWYVDVYGSGAGYIGTFSGHTTDGTIYGWWDLVGPGGVAYTNEAYFDFVVSSDYAGQAPQGNGPQPNGSSTSVPKRTYRQTDNWISKGMWVTANLQAWEGLTGSDLLDIATDGFVTIADGAGLTTRPSHSIGEAFRIQYGSNIPVSTRNSQWQSLRNAIYHPESRNFFYLGHGSPDGIGGSADTNRFITASEISTNLHTLPAGQTNRHGYRFVFLYGCETASGKLPEAFGIIHRENVPVVDYVDAALTPGAFVGWNDKQKAGILGSTFTDNAHFIQHFQWEWTTSGLGVSECLDRAKNLYSDVGFIDRSKLKVFGNWELHPLDFNR
ncbi:MAG TPA: hypothetical protein VFV96_03580 [Verrucomicrobiae bacterium]|nr:hypothetical protein [Verrucomicrobiae bacterium]